MFVFTVGTAGARTNAPAYVQGTYTYHDNGYAITVGYICPNVPTVWGTDPLAEYYALLQHKSSVAVARHSPANLDASVYEVFGFHLSDRATSVLYDDAVTVVC